MPESCSDLGAERHPFAVVPKEALDEALARVEALSAATARPDWEAIARELYEACVEFFQFHGNPNTVHAMRTAMKVYEASLGEGSGEGESQ